MAASRNVLLVEGSSDQHVIRNLWIAHNGEPVPFEVEARGGLADLRDAFRGYLLASEVERLGIVVDADENIGSRWPGFYQALVDRGYAPVPKQPDPKGTVLLRPERTVQTVGVWLMPNNRDPGRLEDFVNTMVADDDRLWSHARRIVSELPESLVRFKPQHRIKAEVHTWLAWQAEPGLRIGQAVTRRLLNVGAPEARDLVDWLRRLFVPGQ